MSKNTDNPGLTRKRRKRAVETDLLAMAGKVDAAIDHAVAGLRRHGYSWTEIAKRIGVTRQAAQKRWSRTVSENA